MNCVKILHAVEKGFLLYMFLSSISLPVFCFARSFALRDWYIVFRVLSMLMLKIYRLLSILERDSGKQNLWLYPHRGVGLVQGSMHANYRLHRLRKRPPPPLRNCKHMHKWQVLAEQDRRSLHADVQQQLLES